MGALRHKSHRFAEAGEVTSFSRLEWVLLEKRNDVFTQVTKTSDAIAPHVLTMIVVATIYGHHSTPKKSLHHVKNLHTAFPLYDCELWLDLPAQSACRISKDLNAEAALAVDEADDPLCSQWPFLLIVRTGRILTVRETSSDEYRRILGVPSI
jgi:hypothetical protein